MLITPMEWVGSDCEETLHMGDRVDIVYIVNYSKLFKTNLKTIKMWFLQLHVTATVSNRVKNRAIECHAMPYWHHPCYYI